MKLKIFIVIVSLTLVSAVEDKKEFKNCSTSSFCRRCRSVSGPSKYAVSLTSLYTDSDSVTADIIDSTSGHLFVLKLKALEDNTFHFEIDEKTPLKTRYRVKEVLLETKSFQGIDVSTSASAITVKAGHNKAVIRLTPFQIEFYHNEVLSVKANGNGLMRFEQLRTKPETLDPSEDPDSWEEAFITTDRTFVDSKPNGPEAIAMDFTFPEADVLFGVPEHADSFVLKVTTSGDPYRLFASDNPAYDVESRHSLYGSVPVLYGHGAKISSGVFWLNSAETYIDIHDMKNAHFISEAGIVDVFILLGPSPHDTFKQYTKLTGVANLPQLFTLGYHQSRWNYETQQEVLEVVANFDKYELPLDTIWLDIEYTDQKKYFTWDHAAFPQPLEMMKNLSADGRHLTYIIDPHYKKDESYFFYKAGLEGGYFVKDKDGNDYEGQCWPELSTYVDFFNPEARKYYADQYLLENFVENSVESGIWNDMNEPAVFDGPEATMPRDNIHHNGFEHRCVHNMYAFMQVKGTYDGLMRRSNGNLRPYILTRAFFSGVQRYSTIWTGDNAADWGHLQSSVKMCLSISVGGVSLCGSDVGGFIGIPEEELFVRWFQAAAFQPFYRAHCDINYPRREPYLLPEAPRAIVREAMRKRYVFLPLWYTMFFEHEHDGKPVMRPMLSEFPLDKNVFKLDDQYMLSDKLMVRPVLEKGVKQVNVQFPSIDGANEGELWYDIDDFTVFDSVGSKSIAVDDHKTPVYQRGGSIIPKKEVIRKSSVFMRSDPISLVVALDKNKHAHGTLYLDDEKSFDYRNGKYLYINFEFHQNKLSLKFIAPANYTTQSKLGRILVAGVDYVVKNAQLEIGGESKDLKVVNATEKFFAIESSDITLMSEWTITVSGSKQLACGSLVIIVAIANVVKNLS